MGVEFGLITKRDKLTKVCYHCGARIEPGFYMTYYHSFTARYFCGYTSCYHAAIDIANEVMRAEEKQNAI